MTKVKVNSGNCKHSVVITAEKTDEKSVRISLETECEMIMNMQDDIAILEMKTLFANFMTNPVYRSAAKHLQHTACPVPSAILKAAEVELGLCLADNVNIEFMDNRKE